MIKNGSKLKRGDMFVVYNSELKYVELSGSGSFVLSNINNVSEYDFPLTTLLCMYLGDNICEEYYSHMKMQINNPVTDKEYYVSIYDKQNSSKDDIVTKAKGFNEIEKFVLDYPIVVEPMIIHNVNDYYVCENSNQENTINLMNKLNEIAKLKYLNSKKEYMANEYDKAYLENMKIEFQKRLIK